MKSAALPTPLGGNPLDFMGKTMVSMAKTMVSMGKTMVSGEDFPFNQ